MEIILSLATIIGGISGIWYLVDSYRKKPSKDDPVSGQLPKPNIKVKTNISLVLDSPDNIQKFLNITVENHSLVQLFLKKIELKLKDGRKFFIPKDSLTGELQQKRILLPGESFDFNILPASITEKVNIDDLVCATITDSINRTYESSEDAFRLALLALFEESDKHKIRVINDDL